MTWSMMHVSSFGDHFLDGDYVGWKENLAKHFHETLSEDNKATYGIDGPVAYAHDVSRKFILPIGPSGNYAAALSSLKPHECPVDFAVAFTRAKSFGSLLNLTDRLLAVDEALKTLIEALEPDVHQFWPIKIMMPNGETHPNQYFGLRIGQHLSSFVPEKSDESAWRKGASGFFIVGFAKKHCAKLAMSKSIIGSAHLWRERRLKTPEIYVSDALAAGIAEAGLRVPKIFRMKDA